MFLRYLGFAVLLMILTPQVNADLSTAPIPQFALDEWKKSIVVTLFFDEAMNVDLVTDPTISDFPAPTYAGAPPDLLIRLIDKNGTELRRFNSWHPLRNTVWEDRVVDGRTVQAEKVVRANSAQIPFVIPFVGNLAQMEVYDVEENRHLITVRLDTIIAEWCGDNPTQVLCRTPQPDEEPEIPGPLGPDPVRQ
jgi:hypothetical protein